MPTATLFPLQHRCPHPQSLLLCLFMRAHYPGPFSCLFPSPSSRWPRQRPSPFIPAAAPAAAAAPAPTSASAPVPPQPQPHAGRKTLLQRRRDQSTAGGARRASGKAWRCSALAVVGTHGAAAWEVRPCLSHRVSTRSSGRGDLKGTVERFLFVGGGVF